jgi:hypothetical protein
LNSNGEIMIAEGTAAPRITLSAIVCSSIAR